MKWFLLLLLADHFFLRGLSFSVLSLSLRRNVVRRNFFSYPEISYRCKSRVKKCRFSIDDAGEAEIDESDRKKVIDADFSVLQILKFIFPTLGIWLSSPIMSLVDTSVVGQRSTVGLAALGPATNLCDALLYGCYFLSVATTNLFAAAIARGELKESQKLVSEGLMIGLLFGIGLSIVILAAGKNLMSIAAGGNTIVIPLAMQYCNVRIIGAPASLASAIAQAACLGAKNSVTPLFVVLFAAALNAIGDWYLVCVKEFGIRGAALATALAEYASMGLLMRAVYKMQQPRFYPMIKLPSVEDFIKFMKFAGPIFITIMCKIVFYTGMTILVTSAKDTYTLAAHTCMLKIFFLFTTFGDSVSQAAQAFLPGVLAFDERAQRKKQPASLEAHINGSESLHSYKMIRKLLSMSSVVGLIISLTAGLIPLRLPHLFTREQDIIRIMHGLVPYLCWSLLLHSSTMCLEGILLAKRELKFLARTYIFNAIVSVLSLSLFSTFKNLSSLQVAWQMLLAFQIFRFGQFGSKLWFARKEEIQKVN